MINIATQRGGYLGKPLIVGAGDLRKRRRAPL